MEVINILIGIIKNRDNSYEYLDIINNKLYCMHLSSDGFSKSNVNYVKNIFKKLFFNDNCIYIKKYNRYDIYYDKETHFKHFIKEGQENFNLFYYLNGNDAVLYESINKNDNYKRNILKTFKIIGVTITLGVGIISFLSNLPYDDSYKYDVDKAIQIIYSDDEISKMYNCGPMDYNDAIEYINKSNIENDIKKCLANKELLQDIFKYYEGTPLQYSANLKVENIHLCYFNVEEYNQDKDNKYLITGYHSVINPNVLFVSDEFKNDNIETNCEYRRLTAHEYIHLLQAEGSPYQYLKEASAELLAKEYFDVEVTSYKPAVKNLMLLIDIIGPEPVMQLLFAGDESNFNNILKNNLTSEDYSKLIKYFQDSSLINDHDEENKKIQSILCTLYKNMYNKDINEDEDIKYDLIYNNGKFDCTNSSKYYIYVRKMNDYDTINMNYEPNIEYLIKLGLAHKITLNTYEKTISLEEFNNNKGETIIEVIESKLPNGQYARTDRVFVYIFKENDYTHPTETIKIEEAYKLGYITFKEQQQTQETNLSDEWVYKSSRKVTVFDQGINKNADGDKIEVTTTGLKNRFRDQYKRMINIENQKILS